MLPRDTLFVTLPSMGLLAQSIAHAVSSELIIAELIQFADGEIEIHIPEPSMIQGKNVCIIQSTNPPVHDSLMRLLFLSNQLSNSGAKTISALIPYFGYARHDESQVPGGQSSMALIAQLLNAAGIHNIITVEVHNPHVINSLAVPVYSISMASCIAAHIKRTVSNLQGVCLIAPDQGAVSRVQEIARILGVGYNSFAKERYATDKTKIVATRGMCKGTTAIIIDDIIVTGGTALNVCKALHQQGYTSIYGYFVHPVLSNGAAQAIQESHFTQIFCSNSIPISSTVSKIKVLDIAHVVGDVISQ